MLENYEIIHNESFYYHYQLSVKLTGRICEDRLLTYSNEFIKLSISDVQNVIKLGTKCVFNDHILLSKILLKNQFVNLYDTNIKDGLLDVYNYLLDNKKLVFDTNFQKNKYRDEYQKALFLMIFSLTTNQLRKLCVKSSPKNVGLRKGVCY